MPSKPPKPCARPGCGRLTHERFCPDCARTVQRAQDQRRGSAHARGYDRRWRAASKQFLVEHPLCQMDCAAASRVTRATLVDHIVPHKGDDALFWDRANWQAGCKPCHDRKTAREDGAFGRAPSPPPASTPQG